jgi:hypothetical protein
MPKRFPVIFLVLILFSQLGLYSQITENSWQIISSKNFDLYLPKSSELNYGRLLQDAENHLEFSEQLIDFHLNESIRLVLSKNPNIVKIPVSLNNSKSTEVELDRHTGYIVSNDEYSGILMQVKNTISSILLNDLLYGKTLQDRIQNKTLLQVPEWFEKGFAAYCNENWLNGYDGAMREVFLENPDAGFNALVENNDRLAGFSFWKFISDQYGKETIANFLYITRLSRSIENGLFFVYGKGMPELFREWQTFYSGIYREEFRRSAKMPPIVNNTYALVNISASPNGRWMAGVTYTRFTTRIVVMNTGKNGVRRTIAELNGKENIIFRWSADNSTLMYNTIEYGNISIAFYSPSRNTHSRYVRVKDFDKLLNFDYDNQRNFIFYGVSRSKLSLVKYSSKDKSVSVLSSEYEVADMRFNENIPFVFYRNDTGAVLVKHAEAADTIASVSSIGSLRILDIDSDVLLFANNVNGIVQAYKLQLSTGMITALTSFTHFALGITRSDNTIWHTIGYTNNNIATYEFNLTDSAEAEDVQPYFSKFPGGNFQQEDESKISQGDANDKDTSGSRYYFLSGFNPDDEKYDAARLDSLRKEEEKSQISVTYLKNYDLTFSTLKVSMLQLDNSNYFNMLRLMPMNPLRPQYFYYYNYIKSEISLKDILNKYQLLGGFRISTSIGGGFDSYFKAEKQYRRYVLSASTYYFQKKFLMDNENDVLKQQVEHASVSYKLKLNEYNHISAEVYGMQEWRTILSREHSSLVMPGSSGVFAGLVAGYEFSRLKKFSDFLYDGIHFEISPNLFYNTFTRHVNADFAINLKYYKPLFRRITWSNHFNINASAGQEKVLNVLGGADYWIFGKYDYNNQFSNQQTYILRNYAGAIRGFRQNARNGSNSFCLNSEFRIPLASLVTKWPTDRDWYRNLLIIPFFDLGSAWDGLNLFSDKNNYTTRIFDYSTSANQNIGVTVKNLRQPVIASFGVGFNTRILGYNLRFDLASGIEDGLVKSPMFMMSYGTSF